jgi:hypothetical protein
LADHGRRSYRYRMQHRISVKALIIEGGRILLPLHRDDAGLYYVLPGARDYIAAHHEFATTDDAHQVELMFHCTLVGGTPGTGIALDNRQIGAEWVELADLCRVRFYPRRLAEVLVATGDAPFGYLGDVN